MIKKKSRAKAREKKHMRIRNRFSGTAERPRLAVFRSNKHIYAQVIDDDAQTTLAAASTVEKDLAKELKFTDNRVRRQGNSGARQGKGNRGSRLRQGRLHISRQGTGISRCGTRGRS